MPALVAFLLSTVNFQPASGADVTTVADLRFMGGQNFFGGEASPINANLQAMVTPAVKVDDRWSFLPTYAGEIRGTKDVLEFAGGGTAFEGSMAHRFTVKGVYSPSPAWKFKASLGGSFEWLRETKDEDWGDGLFDNRRFSAGLEAQRDWSKDAGGRLAYDRYTMAFPNYKSLETSTDPTLSRELAGEKVLDSQSSLLTLSAWSPIPGGARIDAGLSYNLRSFDDQNVVDAAGQFTSAAREDKTLSLSAGWTSRPWALGESLRLVAEADLSYGKNDSNQNHYDARKTKPIPNYYDYAQQAVRPRLTAALGSKPWIVSAGAGYVQRKYSDRVIQDSEGEYLTAKTEVTEVSVSLGLAYPYTRNFKLRALSNMAWSDSNMKYEKTYSYNYKIVNYMVGFSYEY